MEVTIEQILKCIKEEAEKKVDEIYKSLVGINKDLEVNGAQADIVAEEMFKRGNGSSSYKMVNQKAKYIWVGVLGAFLVGSALTFGFSPISAESLRIITGIIGLGSFGGMMAVIPHLKNTTKKIEGTIATNPYITIMDNLRKQKKDLEKDYEIHLSGQRRVEIILNEPHKKPWVSRVLNNKARGRRMADIIHDIAYLVLYADDLSMEMILASTKTRTNDGYKNNTVYLTNLYDKMGITDDSIEKDRLLAEINRVKIDCQHFIEMMEGSGSDQLGNSEPSFYHSGTPNSNTYGQYNGPVSPYQGSNPNPDLGIPPYLKKEGEGRRR